MSKSPYQVNHRVAALLGGMSAIRRSEPERREQTAAIFGLRKKEEVAAIDTRVRAVKAVKTDDEKQIVFGCVYAPGVLDTYGEFMTADDIEQMAYRYMKEVDLTKSIDVRHDNVATTACPVESFIARKGDPDYPEGSWVMGVHVPDPELWGRIKSGELNGFSFQAMVAPVEMTIQYEVIRDHVGPTEKSEDHEHMLFVQVGSDGKVIAGRTSKAADGHFHEITRASVTENAESHSHRYFL